MERETKGLRTWPSFAATQLFLVVREVRHPCKQYLVAAKASQCTSYKSAIKTRLTLYPNATIPPPIFYPRFKICILLQSLDIVFINNFYFWMLRPRSANGVPSYGSPSHVPSPWGVEHTGHFWHHPSASLTIKMWKEEHNPQQFHGWNRCPESFGAWSVKNLVMILNPTSYMLTCAGSTLFIACILYRFL